MYSEVVSSWLTLFYQFAVKSRASTCICVRNHAGSRGSQMNTVCPLLLLEETDGFYLIHSSKQGKCYMEGPVEATLSWFWKICRSVLGGRD